MYIKFCKKKKINKLTYWWDLEGSFLWKNWRLAKLILKKNKKLRSFTKRKLGHLLGFYKRVFKQYEQRQKLLNKFLTLKVSYIELKLGEFPYIVVGNKNYFSLPLVQITASYLQQRPNYPSLLTSPAKKCFLKKRKNAYFIKKK